MLLMVLSLACPSSGLAGGTNSAAVKGTLGVSGDVAAFVDDIEYSTRYRTGETIFGASAALRFFYVPSEHTLFAVGVHGLRRFGDERFFTRALPLFRAQYESEKTSFIIGDLVSAEAHGLPDVMYRQEYRFDPGIEEGIQVRVRLRHFSEDLWVAWDSLNTRAHREHFTAGSSAVFSFADFTCPVFLTADHTGGELYDIPGQPVQEHFGGATGITVSYPQRFWIKRFFGQIFVIGSSYRVRSGRGEAGEGYGFISKAGISPLGFDCSLQWIKGHDLLLPSGDPVYRFNRPVFSFEVARSYSADDRVSVSGGIRFETLTASCNGYFRNPQYRWWIALRSGFERRLGK
jgi:hypothetical protein